MWEQDWTLLSIEPTTDLAAIKKAYALKLRVTRPDDDAEAYQALRGAYERAQQWAKWTSEDDAELPEFLLASPPSTLPVQEAQSAHPPKPAPVLARPELSQQQALSVEPRQLIEALELAWRRDGAEGLQRAWVLAEQTLCEQPLHRAGEFSASFGNWVLLLPQLPDDFVAQLERHFQWLSDFRSERLIGAGLVHSLRAALADRLPEPPPSLELQSQAEPLLRLHQLLSAGGALRAYLLATLLGPTFKRLFQAFRPGTLRSLGLASSAQTDLASLTTAATFLRGGIVTALFMVTALQFAPTGKPALGYLLTWAVSSALLLGAGMVAGFALHTGFDLQERASHQARMARWRRWQHAPKLALALLVTAAAWGALEPVGRWAANGPAGQVIASWADYGMPGVLSLAALTLAWPRDLSAGWTLAALSVMVCILFYRMLGDALTATACIVLGLLWLMLASLVHEHRIAAPEPLKWFLRPALNTLNLQDRWGYVMAMTPVLTVWALTFMGQVDVARAILVWILSILALGWMQLRAERWALSRLAR
jgi:hypothetical protein